MDHLRVVLKVLRERQLFAKYRKYEFVLRSVSFLGHIISTEGVEVDPKTTKVVKHLPCPLDPTDIRSFLTLVCYYKRFVDGFVCLASPSKTLTQKNVNLSCWRYVKELQNAEGYAYFRSCIDLTKGYKGFCGLL